MNQKAKQQIEHIPTADLKPYEKNSRTHSEDQIKQLMKSIQGFGFTNPILIDENNNIIAGHGRLEACKLLKFQEVPCLRLVGLTDEQKKAYIIADNKLALNSQWDFDLLKGEVEALKAANFDLSLVGFSLDELKSITMDFQQGENSSDAAWTGMPEFDQQNKKSLRYVIVHFKEKEDVEKFFQLINQSFTEKTKSVWFPEQPRIDTEAKRYGDDPVKNPREQVEAKK